jgi:predicted O-methyltransferase YrrM
VHTSNNSPSSAKFDAWFKDKTFSHDWASVHFPVWEKFISPDHVRTILEIGSFEGRSAIFFLEHCHQARIVCIDAFLGSDPIRFERNFDANLSAYGHRVEKIRLHSVPALHGLSVEGRLFDLMYIDGSHRPDDVLVDTLLAWRLLKIDGMLIWDDYLLNAHLPEAELRPKRGIDAFLAFYANELAVVHTEYQVIVKKRSTSTAPTVKVAGRIDRAARWLRKGWPSG